MSNRKLEIMNVHATSFMIAKLDSWTKMNAPGLSRAQAITHLAEIGLAAAEVARRRTGGESPMALEVEGLEINHIVTRQREKLSASRSK